jgi:type VI secretion system Hcp family effector
MAIDAFIWFQGYDGKYLESESQVDLSRDPQQSVVHYPPNGEIFSLDDFFCDVDQTLNIGAQSSGTGAGKITFNPFKITRKTDKASPTLFQMACSGTAFQSVAVVLRRSAGGSAPAVAFLKFTFKLVAVKTISWAYENADATELVTFEYGGLVIEYFPQKADGTMGSKVLDGWNRVKNIADLDPTAIVK